MNEIEKLYKNAGVKKRAFTSDVQLKLIEWCAEWTGLNLLKTSAGVFFINHNIYAETLDEVIAKYINEQFGYCEFGEEEKEEIKRILEGEEQCQ